MCKAPRAHLPNCRIPSPKPPAPAMAALPPAPSPALDHSARPSPPRAPIPQAASEINPQPGSPILNFFSSVDRSPNILVGTPSKWIGRTLHASFRKFQRGTVCISSPLSQRVTAPEPTWQTKSTRSRTRKYQALTGLHFIDLETEVRASRSSLQRSASKSWPQSFAQPPAQRSTGPPSDGPCANHR